MEPDSEDERRSPRSKVLLSAILEWPDRSVPVTLRDLSEHGALVETVNPLPADSALTFRRKDLHVHGYGAWVRDNLAGIAFSEPLKAEVLLRHIVRPVRRQVDNSRYRRPGFAVATLSPEEKQWIREM